MGDVDSTAMACLSLDNTNTHLKSNEAPSAPPSAHEHPVASDPVLAADDASPEALSPAELMMEAVADAENLVQKAFEKHDPSHDFHHVHRVRLLALSLSTDPTLRRPVDKLVVELAALFHDLVDRKYLPTSGSNSSQSPTAQSILGPYLDAHKKVLGSERSATICRITDNVSWSKDQTRRTVRLRAEKAGVPLSPLEQDAWEWEQRCIEYQLVSDADRLDAIGSFGIMRCAAFAAVKNQPLHVPPNNAQSTSAPPFEQSQGYSSSAIAHFYSKLVKIRGENLWTKMARKEAERRQQVMSSFLTEIDLEWMVAEQGLLHSTTGLW